MKQVILAEKKNAAEDIARALSLKNIRREGKEGFIHAENMDGDEVVVTWSSGHCLRLLEPEEIDKRYGKWRLEDLPVPLVSDKELKVITGKGGLYTAIERELRSADYIVNAGDAGREGELIQRWIMAAAIPRKRVPVSRLWVQSLTPAAIRKGWGDLLGKTDKEADRLQALYDSGRARAIMDMYIGYNYSRLISLTQTDGVTVNYGRCKSPLIHAIVKRDKEIRGFVSRPFSKIRILVEKEGESFQAYLADRDSAGKKKEFFEDEKELADSTLRSIGNMVMVEEVLKEEKKALPPKPFDTLQIQKEMARRYDFEADKTLSILQKLYDEYHILSYPRTDARYFTEDIRQELKGTLHHLKFGRYEEIIDRIDTAALPDRYVNDKKIADHHALCPVGGATIREKYKTLTQDEKRVYDAVIDSFLALFLPAHRYEAVTVVLKGAGDDHFVAKGKTILEEGWKCMAGSQQDAEEDEEEKGQALPDVCKGEELSVTDKEIIDGKTKPKPHFTTPSLLDFMRLHGIGTGATRDSIIKDITAKKGYNAEAAVRKEGKYFLATVLGEKIDSVIPEELKSIDRLKILEQQIQAIADGELSIDEFIAQMEREFTVQMQKLSEASAPKITSERPAESVLPDISCPACGGDLRDTGWGYGCANWKKDGSGCQFAVGKEQFHKKLSDKVLRQLIIDGQTRSKLKGLKGRKAKPFDAFLCLEVGEQGRAKIRCRFD